MTAVRSLLAVSFLFIAAALLAAPPPFATTDETILEEWRETTIRIGNERDGFNDSVPGRISFTRQELFEGRSYLPFIAKAPDEERVLLLLGSCGVSSRFGILLESTDNCESWHTPVPAGDRGIDGWGLTCLGKGRILCTDALYLSEDNGATWQPMGGFPVDPRFGEVTTGWSPQVAVPGSDGMHLLKTLYFTRNFFNMESRCVPLLCESFDGGKSWSAPRGIPEFTSANEVTLAYNAKGELIAGIRTDTAPAPVNDEYNRLEYAFSQDNGATWSQPKVLAGNGRMHPSFVLLPDGRMVVTYVVRMGYRDTPDGKYAYGIEAMVSEDGGHTWDTAHRYMLSYWTSDCVVDDGEGGTCKVDRWMAGPTNTSTVYLPSTGELVTVYGTKQFCSRRHGDATLPWQSGIVKWRPADSYSGVKSPAPAPIPAEEALRRIRGNRRWPVNYQAAVGMPDSGWINRYPENLLEADGEWLCFDHRHARDGYLAIRGIDFLEVISAPVALRARIEIPPSENADPSKSYRLVIYAAVGSGQDKYAIPFFIDGNADVICNQLGGAVELPTQPGTPFLLEAFFDPYSGCTRLWIDGKLVKEQVAPYAFSPAETPAQFYFGGGTTRISGQAKVSLLQFAPLP